MVWYIHKQGTTAVGHVIGFGQEDILRLTSLFSVKGSAEVKLHYLLSKVILYAKEDDEIETINLSIGDNQVPLADAINELGLDLQTEESYFTKNI